MAEKQPLGSNQEAWLKALESGEYAQAKNVLCTENLEYCCLGVGCDVANISKGLLSAGRFWFGSEAADIAAPKELVEHLALYGDNGQPRDGTAKPMLTGLNDECDKSLPEIAAIIRSDPSVYFMEPR